MEKISQLLVSKLRVETDPSQRERAGRTTGGH